jgi:hypothetical protein
MSRLRSDYGSLLHGLHDGLSRLLHGLNHGLSRLHGRFGSLLHSLNHGLSCLRNGFGNLLYGFNHGSRCLLYSLSCILYGGHAFDLFLHVLTGSWIKNLECLSHFSCAVLSSCAARGVDE